MGKIFQRKRGGKWVCQFKNEHGEWKQETAYTDKTLSQKKLNELEFAAEQKRRGWGGKFDDSKATKYSDHLEAFKRALVMRRNTTKHVTQTIQRIEKFGFASLADLFSPTATDRVAKVLARFEPSTSNHHLTALKSFCRWLIDNDRLPKTPITKLKKVRVVEPEVVRRALTKPEAKRLLQSLKDDSFNMSGKQRYWLYATALNTGFRAKELASLNAEDFGKKSIKCAASYTKDRIEVHQPVSESFCAAIKRWLPKSGKVWGRGRWCERAADMLAVDLKNAKIEVSNKEGVVDFHALRTTYITSLVLAGFYPEQCRKLARHKDITTTMRY
jgi:integrase